MQKIKAIITGRKVHDVGYRVLLVNKALSLGIDNFNAFNTHFDGGQAVIVIIEADDETMEEFKSFLVSARPEKSLVAEVSLAEYRNNVPPIERIMQSFQMEQWGKGIPILLQMLDKQDQMLDKQDTSISILESFKEESNSNFSDLKQILRKHDIDAGERFASIQKDIFDIKNRLSSVESAVSMA